MLHTGTERRGDSPSAFLPSFAEGDLRLAASTDQRARYAAERALDQVLAALVSRERAPTVDAGSRAFGSARSCLERGRRRRDGRP